MLKYMHVHVEYTVLSHATLYLQWAVLYLFDKVLSSCWRIIHLLPFWHQKSTLTAHHILDKDILEQINIQETLWTRSCPLSSVAQLLNCSYKSLAMQAVECIL